MRLLTQSRSYGVVVCTWKANHAPDRTCPTAEVSVNVDPQAMTDFNRWEVEAAQNAAQSPAGGPGREPTPINRLGIRADWVPVLHELATVDDQRWIEVTMTCPAHDSGEVQARPLARAALRTPLS